MAVIHEAIELGVGQGGPGKWEDVQQIIKDDYGYTIKCISSLRSYVRAQREQANSGK